MSEGYDGGGESKDHYTSVLRDVYGNNSGGEGEQAPAFEESAPPEDQAPQRLWRQRAAEYTKPQRQTPEQTRKLLLKMAKKREPRRYITIPSMFKTSDASMGDVNRRALDRSLGLNVAKSDDAKTETRKKLASDDADQSKKSATREQRFLNLKTLPTGIKPEDTYQPVAPDSAELYKTVRSELKTLPLELFDNDENDPTPQEWVALGKAKYNQRGTPAKSLYFDSGNWVWTDCVVLRYNPETRYFLVEFKNEAKTRKNVPRLSIVFQDEDYQVFLQRLENCKILREECLAIRRYTKFVESQPNSLFSPIQQSALHGIVGKVMTSADELVISRKPDVEGLLREVRDEYSSAMKQAIIDFRRLTAEEDGKMASLRLPPVPTPPVTPYLAVIEVKRSARLHRLIKDIQQLHFTHHPEATLVVQAIFKAWDTVKYDRFLDTEDTKMQLPMTLYEYQDHQDQHFATLKEKVINDWHSLAINLVRDNLNSVFKLLSHEMEDYNRSELKRFLKMVTLMLRKQLTTLLIDSMEAYLRYFLKYSDDKSMTMAGKAEVDGEAKKKTEEQVLEGYLGGARAGMGVLKDCSCLFVFKMSTHQGKVIFSPALDSIEVTLLSLISLPIKVEGITQIDNEVVPLLGIGESPLCSDYNVPLLYEACKASKNRLKDIIDENLEQPQALQTLYQRIADMLTMDIDDYVKEWFGAETEERMQARLARKEEREEADRKKREEAEEEDYNPRSKGRGRATRATKNKPKQEAVKVSNGDDEDAPKEHTLEETHAEIKKYLQAIEDIRNLSPTEVRFRMIKVECHLVKEHLIAKATEVSRKLMEGLCAKIRQDNEALCSESDVMLQRIKQKSTTVNELAELKELTKKIETEEIPRLQNEIKLMQARHRVLEDVGFSISREDFDLAWTVVKYPLNLLEVMEDTKMDIEADNNTFQKALRTEQAVFQADLEAYSREVDTFVTFGIASTIEMEQYASKVEGLQDKLVQSVELVKSFNEREEIFGEVSDEYTELAELQRRFRPYFQLWSTAQAFNSSHAQWTTGAFMELDPEQIATDVGQWQKLMYKLDKEFKSLGAAKPAQVAAEMRNKIGEFQQNVPIIGWLRNPGLHARHWEKISEVLIPGGQTTLSPDELSLRQVLALDVVPHAAFIEEIANNAQKEWVLEQAFAKMAKEWKEINMELEEYKNTKTYVIKKSEDILGLLDEQLMKTQSMRGSPYIKPLEPAPKIWENRLQLMSQIMEEWLTCQKTWIYLEPIFGSEDINRQMPKEGKRFKTVDAYWRKTMTNALKTPNFFEFVAETENLLKTFQESNRMLEQIGKRLNAYLDSKRMAFPRFFFLSNMELLSILSQTKNPLAVQPHMNKCFDAINALIFSDKLVITGLKSAKGEIVPYNVHIDPNEGAKRGNVEVWLKDVETTMKTSLHRLTRLAIKEFSQKKRSQWVLDHASMVVLTVNSLMWTADSETALNGGTKGLQTFYEKMMKGMQDLILLVRGDLTKLQRCTLEPLMTIEVHNRDIIQKLIKNKIESVKEFDWLSQMRYYWDTRVRGSKGPVDNSPELAPDGNVQVRMINTVQQYGWEYLGNSGRLVITPLTDRCYRTLMGAVQLHLGGAPEGPAGTGKTETVKDLAKALAIQCIVINCSEAITYKGMAKFFKGLASSGAWACFDEFNRIGVEVLSVIAQQINTIQNAIVAGKSQVFFDGVTIPVVPTCSAFITMNPSEGGAYAGRSELPDNLKALFRTVAMMIPDYAMIAEIALFSQGFSDASELSTKIVRCLRLSSEQLSSQKHYDFGMRTVKSVLTAAGSLKRKYPNESEDVLCLRAIEDCNVPKFLSQDLPLFSGICKDLFPRVQLERKQDEELSAAVRQEIMDENLQFTDNFYFKIMQLYDTVLVRHGLMIVGAACSAKSANIRILSRAMTTLAKAQPDSEVWNQVKVTYINPKAISLRELYGFDDPNTHEWTDGVVPVAMRDARDSSIENGRLRWMCFDGPVDALWIENMNTVLDDNKKLCLSSGEQIKLTPQMTMLFEVENLDVASPATVSRCGMVYMEPKSLGWGPIVESWIATLPALMKAYDSDIRALFAWIVAPSLEFVSRFCKPICTVSDIQKVVTLTNVFSCMLDEFYDLSADMEEIEKKEEERKQFLQEQAAREQKEREEAEAEARVYEPDTTEVPDIGMFSAKEIAKRRAEIEKKVSDASLFIEPSFIFATVWSIGGVLDVASRKKFSNFFKQLVSGSAGGIPLDTFDPKFSKRIARLTFPSDSASSAMTVYDWKFDKSGNAWRQFMDGLPEFKIPEKAQFHEIVVPTVDSVRLTYMLDLLVTRQQHVLMVGGTGTGKTLNVHELLDHHLDQESYQPLYMHFSARSTAGQTQDIIDENLERRRAGVLGPVFGKRCVVFIDDLNMPAPEEFGAQPPIELLRQWMDYNGWYNRKTNSFQYLVDIQFIGAMGPPGAGGALVTQRFLRHFNTIGLNPFNDESLERIYGTILRWWIAPFAGKVRTLSKSLVKATIELYNEVSHGLLPTPAKSHYTFNLRDVSAVFRGMLGVAKNKVSDPNDMLRLWVHECQRTFCDRLVSKQDIQTFDRMVGGIMESHFETKMTDIVPSDGSILFADYTEGSNATKREYQEVKGLTQLVKLSEEFLDDYNHTEKNEMNLVMFADAVQHVARAVRVLQQPSGHLLLVGVGGSGRTSCTRLATHIAGFQVKTVEISKTYGIQDWREDLIDLFKMAGVENKNVVFLLAENQLKNAAFLEDVSSILNTGKVPHLFETEEYVQVVEAVRADATKVGMSSSSAEIFAFFLARAKEHIHVVLTMSPIGDALRKNLRMFPSLVNCTSIDWFHSWPTQALHAVATHFLSSIKEINQEMMTKVVDVCVSMQERVIGLSEAYWQGLRRKNYVTPTSYLTLIKIFKELFNKKYVDIGSNKARYENGLEKLKDTSVQVLEMQVELNKLRPQLIQSSEDTEKLIQTIDVKTKQVSQTRKIVSAEEKECNEQAEAAQKVKDECEGELAKALPALQASTKALKSIKRGHLDELKGMKVPTSGVLLTMEAMCIMFGIDAKKVGQVGNKTLDYWEPARKKLLGNPKFLQKVMKYDKDNIPLSVINKIKNYVKNPEFQPAKVAHSSVAAEALCRWVLAMEMYDTIFKTVEPKRRALDVAEKQLTTAYKELQVKKNQLKEVQDLLNDLTTQFQVVNEKKLKLQHQVEECTERLDRAEKLINGLSSEKKSWAEKAVNLGMQAQNVVGDILVSSGIVAYLGIFTPEYRESCTVEWIALMKDKGIPIGDDYSLAKVLGNDVQIQQWHLQALPKDSFSITNALMMKNGIHWPLVIDPQEQANTWIKKMETLPDQKESNLKVLKQSEDHFIRILSTCISRGVPVLIENMGEKIDPALEPLLTKQIQVTGNMMSIRMGNETINYDKEFRLYMTTKLFNPHYSPDISTKVQIISFAATPKGLQDQMLSTVVGKEQPELEQRRNELIVKNAKNLSQLEQIEKKILYHLEESKVAILDDEDLVHTLQKSKNASKLIEKKLKKAEQMNIEINNARQDYQPLAKAIANLFFCISDMASVDPMYQYSLNWFTVLFKRAIIEAEADKDVETRTKNIEAEFLRMLYDNVCRSLFEKDKLFFSFLLYLRILANSNLIVDEEVRFFLTGGGIVLKGKPNPTRDPDTEVPWLPDSSWNQLQNLNNLTGFVGICDDLKENPTFWKTYYDAKEPFDTEFEEPFKFTWFHRLMVLRVFRPDRVVTAIATVVRNELGKEFVQPPPFDLVSAYADSSSTQPLIFVLSPGVDPNPEIQKLALEMGYATPEKCVSISLGQGQGPFAENAIREAIDAGTWVVLQNCHLSVSWLPVLEKVVDEIDPQTTNKDFRLWLTSMPSPHFPVSILQNGVKITNEPPKGLKANLTESYRAIDNSWFGDSASAGKLSKLLFGLTFFHALIQERRKFGPLGWNKHYEWNKSDLAISKTQLHSFATLYSDIPFDALQYLIGQLNYGGRVTDEWDRRTLVCILQNYVAPCILDVEYKFDSSNNYYVPDTPIGGDDLRTIRNFISSLPDDDGSNVFGLHDNVNIATAMAETNNLLATLLSLQPRTQVDSGDSESGVVKLAKDIEVSLPELFDLEEAEKRYPVDYKNSMNTVLVQELMRYNKLLGKIKQTLKEVQRAAKGEVVMSAELEMMANSLFINQVPQLWKPVSYPSLKPLGGWVADLLKRITMFQSWLDSGAPSTFWISGFFFTQSFLTGTLQNYARRHQIAIDALEFDFEVRQDIEPDHKVAPDDGCYIHGLFMDGARWDSENQCMGEQEKRKLFSSMPVIHLIPRKDSDIDHSRSLYECPVYKTSIRRGTLSTTGHSTNFVLSVQLPIINSVDHWIQRSAALLCQLDED